MVTRNPIVAYTKAQTPKHAAIGRLLRKEIDAALPKSISRIYHSIPVWFIEENAVVGFSSAAVGVKLLFWNGQSFKEEGLVPVGKFEAAQVVFADKEDIDLKDLRRWLKKARTDIWDLASLRRARQARTR